MEDVKPLFHIVRGLRELFFEGKLVEASILRPEAVFVGIKFPDVGY